MADKIREIHVPTPSELIEKGSRTITGRTDSPIPPKAPAGLGSTPNKEAPLASDKVERGS